MRLLLIQGSVEFGWGRLKIYAEMSYSGLLAIYTPSLLRNSNTVSGSVVTQAYNTRTQALCTDWLLVAITERTKDPTRERKRKNLIARIFDIALKVASITLYSESLFTKGAEALISSDCIIIGLFSFVGGVFFFSFFKGVTPRSSTVIISSF